MEPLPAVNRRDDKSRRDLVRRTALLLSANLPLAEVFDEICVLLAHLLDAPAVLISTLDGDGLRAAYARGESKTLAAAALGAIQGAASHTPGAIANVPIVFGGQVIGIMSVQGVDAAPYGEDDLEALETCALYLGALMHDDRHHRSGGDPARVPDSDPLTGIAGRKTFDERAEGECRRCERAGTSLAVLLLDVDYFKAFNDAYGHVAGDMCLRQIARAICSVAGRPGDVVGRYSGEQFAAALSATTLEGALIVAEKMREAVFGLAIPHERSTLRRLSVSIGAFSAVPERGAGTASMLVQAEHWMRQAKTLGRNRVCAPEYESTARGAGRRASSQHNLPQPRTSFIGRTQDVARVRGLLETERVITLVGPGGTGKTRMAIEAAHGMLEHFQDGVWFLDLTTVNDLAAMFILIASVTGLGSVETDDPDRFAARMQGRHFLLVLDNCEQLIDECKRLVDAVLTHAPQVKMLLTSRQALGVSGERIYRLPMLAQEDAQKLFVERASHAGADAPLDPASVEYIVRRLDGLPLAIELAAARLTVMSVEDLTGSLDDCLNLLSAQGDGMPTRQQTVRALIDWSYRLLNDREKRLLRRLAAFPATWALQAVEPVTQEPPAVLEMLVSKSLVQRIDFEKQARFRFLHITHGYAQEFLAAAGEQEKVTADLGLYFSDLAVLRAAELKKLPMRAWLAMQRPDCENYVLALRWALDRRHEQGRAEAMLESMRHWFHERANVDFRDLLPLFEQLLHSGELSEGAMAGVALAAADLYGTRDLRRSRDAAERALKFYREVGDGLGAAHALERLASAQRYLEGGVDTQLETPIRNAVFAAKREGDMRLASMLLRLLSDIYSRKGDGATERAMLHESYELLRDCGDDDRTGGVLGRLAVAMFWNKDFEEARNTGRAAVTLLEQAGEPWNLAFQMMNLGLFEIFRNDYTAARVALQKSMDLLRRYGHEYAVPNTFTYYALLAYRLRQLDRSVRLVGYADALFDTGPRQQLRLQRIHDDLIKQLRQALGDEEFERNRRTGRALSREQALEETTRV